MAASTVCNALTKSIATRKCLPSGGVKVKMWIFQVADMSGVETISSDGALSSFGLNTGYQAITCTGRPKKGKGDNKLTQAVDAALGVDQSLAIEVAYGSQDELDAIMAFLRAEGKTAFVETNSGDIRQYFHEFGTDSLEGTDGSGALVTDAPNIVAATLKGSCTTLPRFFKAVITGQLSQLAASRAYLDGLLAAAASS